MSLQNTTRSGGNAPALPGAKPLSSLSRRAAMVGAIAAAGFKAHGVAHAADLNLADAALIDLAGNLAGMIAAEKEAWDRHAQASDAADQASPAAPVRREVREPYAGLDGLTREERTARFRANPTAFWAESAAADTEHKAAMAEHQRIVAGIEKRHGLARLERLATRSSDQVSVASEQLADMAATCPTGLAAKARVLLAVVGNDPITRSAEFERHAALLESLLRDAARLGTGRLA